jgi:6-phosphogluconate dehydrogenase
VADHGFTVALFNRTTEVTQEVMAENPGQSLVPCATLPELVTALERPRVVMILVKAGKPVDAVLDQLVPLLEPGDIVIDGGNTWFPETQAREQRLRAMGLHFVGMGVSGGEEGARRGPSLMPGGSVDAWSRIQPIFEAIAARTDSGPCVTHVGPDGAGHFVKMVHNGIEYGDMQLIAEAYDVLGRGLGMKAPELAEIFEGWNQGPLASFLVEITGKVLRVTEPATGKPLVDLVQDKAGQKGTGKWTAQCALDLGVAIPTIAAAIDARVMSAQKEQRVAAASVIRGSLLDVTPGERAEIVKDVHDALHAAKITSYAQGLELMTVASTTFGWNISLREMARIWKGGCIIRARLLDAIMRAYERTPGLANLLLDGELEAAVRASQPGWRRTLQRATALGIPMPAMSASLAYFDSVRTARLPQNLTQAQRDAFGAHTYERLDKLDLGFIHTEWLGKA